MRIFRGIINNRKSNNNNTLGIDSIGIADRLRRKNTTLIYNSADSDYNTWTKIASALLTEGGIDLRTYKIAINLTGSPVDSESVAFKENTILDGLTSLGDMTYSFV